MGEIDTQQNREREEVVRQQALAVMSQIAEINPAVGDDLAGFLLGEGNGLGGGRGVDRATLAWWLGVEGRGFGDGPPEREQKDFMIGLAMGVYRAVDALTPQPEAPTPPSLLKRTLGRLGIGK